jgi:hypothetical protein
MNKFRNHKKSNYNKNTVICSRLKIKEIEKKLKKEIKNKKEKEEIRPRLL